MDHIARIAQLDHQIKTIDKIIKDGEYLAAGVTLSLNVGPLSDDRDPDMTIDLGVVADLKGILNSLKDGLVKSREFRVGSAKNELQRLQAFFAKENP